MRLSGSVKSLDVGGSQSQALDGRRGQGRTIGTRVDDEAEWPLAVDQDRRMHPS